MTSIAFAAPAFMGIKQRLMADRRETAAVAFTRTFQTLRGHRAVVCDVEFVPDEAYVERTPISISLEAQYVMGIANRARAGGYGIVLLHSHPGDDSVPAFSPIDDAGEEALAAYFNRRVPLGPHFAMVVSAGGAAARFLGTHNAVAAVEVGSELNQLTTLQGPVDGLHYDRQIRAFGRGGQTILQALRVAVIGLGGTGSVTAQQLAHLGIGHFDLIDPDTLEPSNVNRVVGSMRSQASAKKVDVARQHIESINPSATVHGIAGDVTDASIARSLLDADVIFLCTDSHASRAVVCQLAYQYLIPCIDMGVSISVRDGRIAYITGRVQMLAPGLPCLTCVDALDAEQIRRDLLSPAQRASDPYITGVHEPQPAVISLNSTVASLAVTMFMGASLWIEKRVKRSPRTL